MKESMKEIELNMLRILAHQIQKVGRTNLTKDQKIQLKYLEKKYGENKGKLSFRQFNVLDFAGNGMYPKYPLEKNFMEKK